MVSALDFGLTGQEWSPSHGHCAVLLGKTIYSHSASLHPGIKVGTANCWGPLTECWEVTCDKLASCPGGVAILLATP